MKSAEELTDTAMALADELRSEMRFADGSMGRGFWRASQQTDREKIRARGTTGLEFFRVYAGPDSSWYLRARGALDGEDKTGTESAVHFVGELLESWARQVANGTATVVGEDASSARTVVSTDVMEQVRTLMSDKSVHPAAPIVLAGAALETALREAVEESGLTVSGKGGISSYGTVLRGAELISKQDMKDIEQMAGLRNAAAHGDFEELSRERAGLMEQQVNMFLARLSTMLGD